MESRKKYIGIFGGTFDPPHKGHIAIAEKAVKQLQLSVVYFVPAYLPPHKLNRDFVTAKQRLAMLKLAVKGHRNFKISTIELKRRGISYTIDTLKSFKRRFPKAEFILIIGADNLAQFYSWKSPREILKLSSIAVYKRKGFESSFKKKDIAFRKIKGDILQVSSTEVRQRLRKGVSVTKLLPKQVLQYIKRHSLYINPRDSRY